ncbi:MAG: hypothetical protein HZRFUVUK_001298 [Candidatus Fervidibacterota bacterium]|jgi:hypothetical protein
MQTEGMELRTFKYRRYASGWIVLLFIAWVFGVVTHVAVMWFPFENPMTVKGMFALLFASFGFGIYCSYLVIVNMTAVILLDRNGITYRDRYVKVNLKWEDVCEMTMRWVKDSTGRAIYFKLGMHAIDGWKELQQLIVERASLSEVVKRKLPFVGEAIVHAKRP